MNIIQMFCVCWVGGLSLKHCTFLYMLIQFWASDADVGLTLKRPTEIAIWLLLSGYYHLICDT